MSALFIDRTQFGDEKNKGNVLTEAEALTLLESWVPNARLQLHMKQVGAVMKAWALQKEGLNESEAHKWWLAGLLHDADWEQHPDKHPQMIIAELEHRNIDPEVIRAIASHGPRHFGVQPQSRMDQLIYAVDELSGFIHAAALIRPTRYEGLDAKSILKKLKTPSFAAQVNRDEITEAGQGAGVSAEELIPFIIEAQKEVA